MPPRLVPAGDAECARRAPSGGARRPRLARALVARGAGRPWPRFAWDTPPTELVDLYLRLAPR